MSIDALLHVGLLVVAAKLGEGLLRRIRLNAIVAYTLAGVLLGPATGIVEPTDEIQVFLAVGVAVFFFLIGLDELDLPGFKATIRGPYFVAAAVSFAISVLASLVVTSDVFGLGFALHDRTRPVPTHILVYDRDNRLIEIDALDRLCLVALDLGSNYHLPHAEVDATVEHALRCRWTTRDWFSARNPLDEDADNT